MNLSKIPLTLLYFIATVIPWYILIAGGVAVETTETRLMLFAAACILILPILPIFLPQCGKRLFFGVLGMVVFLVGARIVLFPLQANISVSQNSALQSVYSGGEGFSVFGWNLISEEEWIRMGVGVSSLMAITPEQKTFIRNYIDRVYPQIRRDPEFTGITSVIGIGFSGMFHSEMSGFHHFAYTPAHPVSDRLTVFLQGNACNFLVYPWIFRNLANAIQEKIIFPSFLFGDWQLPGGMESIQQAIQDSRVTQNTKINLVGLSNGGRGISRYIRDHGESVHKAVYISAVMEPEILTDPAFLVRAQNMDGILVIHGVKDDRVGIDNIRSAVDFLTRNHVRVSLVTYPNSDHFLLFEKEQDILGVI